MCYNFINLTELFYVWPNFEIFIKFRKNLLLKSSLGEHEEIKNYHAVGQSKENYILKNYSFGIKGS